MEKDCQHTEGIIQQLNKGVLQPADETHLSGCGICRAALEIRTVLMKTVPASLPDRSALLWQQYTINRILKKDSRSRSVQLWLSLLLQTGLAALFGGLIYLGTRAGHFIPGSLTDNKMLGYLDELFAQPAIIIVFLLAIPVLLFVFRSVKYKT